MKKDARFMLLGIYLLVASLWCIALGAVIVGSYILPLISLVCMVRGFCGKTQEWKPDAWKAEDTQAPATEEDSVS